MLRVTTDAKELFFRGKVLSNSDKEATFGKSKVNRYIT